MKWGFGVCASALCLLSTWCNSACADLSGLLTTEAPWRLRDTASATRSVPLDADWSAFAAVELTVRLSRPAGGEVPVRAYFFIVTGEDLYYQTSSALPLGAAERTVRLNLGSNSPDWSPSGHHRPWCRFNLRRIRCFGIKVFMARPAEADAHITAARLLPLTGEPAAEPARVYKPVVYRLEAGLRSGGETAGVLYAFDFLLLPESAAPFTASAAPRVLLITPDGERIEKSAFYYQHYAALAEPVTEPADLAPVGLPRWRILFRAAGTGECTWRVLLPDGGKVAEGAFALDKAAQVEYPEVTAMPEYPLALYRLPVGSLTAAAPAGSGWQPLSQAEAGYGWYIPIEWNASWCHYAGLGFYDLRVAYFADMLLACSSQSLPMILCHRYEMSENWTFRWSMHPLSRSAGGPLEGPSQFFLREAAREAVFNRAAYLARRWGAYGSVSGIAVALDAPLAGAVQWHERLAEALAAEGIGILSTHPAALPPLRTEVLASFERADVLAPLSAEPVQFQRAARTRKYATHGEFAMQLTPIEPEWRQRAPVFELVFGGVVSLATATHLAVDVYMPAGAPGAARVQFYMRDGDLGWYEYLSPTLLRPDDYTTVLVPLADGWRARGDSAEYSDYVRHDVRVLGMRIYCNEPYKGNVFVDNVRALRFGHEPAEPLRFAWLDAPAARVPVWGKYEARFGLEPAVDNPFDPAVIDVKGSVETPAGEVIEFPAFFYQQFERTAGRNDEELLRPAGQPHWRWRFAPTEPGRYRVRLKATLHGGRETARSEAFAFSAVPSDNKGPVKVLGPNGFGFADGSRFYPIGLNLRSPSDERDIDRDREVLSKVQLAAKRGTFQYDDYFTAMHRHGLNWARLWMCSWWLGLEWYRNWPGYKGKGRYNLANAWRLDHLLEEAGKNNIYLQLYLMNHGQVSTRIDHEWEYHPYNYYEPEAYQPHSRQKDQELQLRPDADNFRRPGGFIKDPVDFFTSDEARRLFRNRLRYAIARWGYSQHVFAWVLASEVEFTAEYWLRAYDRGRNFKDGLEHSPLTARWHQEMARYVKQQDVFDHMVTTHFSHPVRGPDVWALPELDFVQSNAYSTFWWFGGRGEDVEHALKAGQPSPSVGAPRAMELYYTHFMSRWERPVIIGEWGGHWMSNARDFLDAELHTGTWALVCSPMAGATGFWWWPHVHFRDRYALIEPAVRFAAASDRPAEGIGWLPVNITGPAPGFSGRAAGRGDWGAEVYIHHQSLAFDLKKRPRAEGLHLTIGGLSDAAYSVTFWDAWSGRVIGEAAVECRGGSVRIVLPPFDGQMALRLRKSAAGSRR